jgi:hypothetical protein
MTRLLAYAARLSAGMRAARVVVECGQFIIRAVFSAARNTTGYKLRR